ncbi:hypothetical protein N9242_00435 [Vicingaceae bacterium]|nr:hypothetical protein [Vicingaceae bacterium]
MIEFILSAFYFLIFCLIIIKTPFFKDENIPQKWFLGVFGIKVIAGVLLTLIYSNYYSDRSTADIFKYFDDGKILFDAFESNPKDYLQMMFGINSDTEYFNSIYYQKMKFWTRAYEDGLVSDTHIIIRFNALLQFFSFGYFNVHNVFMNFISFIGLVALFKAFKHFLKGKERILFLIISLIPSVLFWGSGLLKEGIIFLGLGLFLYSFFKLTSEFKLKYILIGLIGILLIVYTKLYLIVALFIPIVGFSLNKAFKRTFYGYLFSSVTFMLLINLIPLINPQLNFVKQIVGKQLTFSRFIASVETNSGFSIPELSNGLSLLKNIPNALLNTILRPFLWESNSAFILMSFAENTLLLVFITICLIFSKKMSISQKNVFYFCFIFTFTLFVLIGLTTPTFGAIVRYKIPGLLLISISMLLILDVEKIKTKFPILSKLL